MAVFNDCGYGQSLAPIQGDLQASSNFNVPRLLYPRLLNRA